MLRRTGIGRGAVDRRAQVRELNLDAPREHEAHGALAAVDGGEDPAGRLAAEIRTKLLGLLVGHDALLDEKINEGAAVLREGGTSGDEGAAEQREPFQFQVEHDVVRSELVEENALIMRPDCYECVAAG